jgi:hypothetical protein
MPWHDDEHQQQLAVACFMTFWSLNNLPGGYDVMMEVVKNNRNCLYDNTEQFFPFSPQFHPMEQKRV